MSADFQVCVNCGIGQPGYPHPVECPRPKYMGAPDPDARRPLPAFPPTRTFIVAVRETRLFWDQVRVHATTPQEAEALALQQYAADWDESLALTVTSEVLEVKP